MTSLSGDQSKVIDQIQEWYESLPKTWLHCNGATDCPGWPHTHGTGMAPVKSLGGLAGSGKTTLMRELDLLIQGEALFGTPTHKAANVLRRKLGPKQAERVRTYHSTVYQMTPVYRCTITNHFVSALKGKCTCGMPDACECPMSFLPCGTGATHTCHVGMELKEERREHLGGHRDIVIIDESSMLSDRQVNDLRRFGVPVLVVGDRGQLPPIKDPMNQWTMNPDWELTEIHRQGADSGVLLAAHDVRANGRMSKVSYGNGDAIRMARTDPRFKPLLSRFTPGTDGALITYTNKMRAEFNRAYHGDGPVREGDRVVALGGKPYDVDLVEVEGSTFRLLGQMVKVHNGMTGTVRTSKERSIMTEMTVELDDHPLAEPGKPVVIYAGAVPSAQFGAERELSYDSPLRPRGSNLWDFGYALTAHKAQGSEFDKVIVVDQQPREYRQWMYTALTRAKKAVIAVDWAK